MTSSRAPGRRRLPQRAVVALVVAAALGLAACGEKSEGGGAAAQPLSLVLDARPGPNHAGVFMAQRLGYFREAGIELTVRPPSAGASPIELVAAGRADLAISHEPDVLLAQQRGLDAMAVGALVDIPLNSLIWLRRSGIAGVAALRGKTIATTAARYQDAYLGTILAGANLSPADVRTIDAGGDPQAALLGGRAQATLGGFRNLEGVALRLRGRRPEATPVDELGVPAYDELVVVARRSRVEEDPKPIRLFLGALARGTAAAVGRPAASTEALLEANPDLEPRLTRAQVEATLPLLAPDRADRPYGYMDPAQWREFIGWMRDQGQISSLPSPSRVLTNELLPGEIPD